MARETGSPLIRPYSKHEWRVAASLFVSYIAVYELCALLVPASAHLWPASAIALSALFFGGLRLWPVVYLAALAAGFIAGAPHALLVVLPIAEALQAAAGAYLLRAARVDPLFRRYRDTFYFTATALFVSCIVPTIAVVASAFLGVPFTGTMWGHTYASTLFCLFIITPFILRWFAKARFSRTLIETIETVAIFAILIGIDYALFVAGVPSLLGIPLAYYLLIPLFWIALRLRPRFVTLALLMTSIFAVSATVAHASAAALAGRLFGVEAFLIALAAVFYIIVSLEEDRRVNMNLMRSQLSTLENAVARVSSESSAKNDFIAILAHELRNPLAPVVSAIDLMKLKGGRDEEDTEALDMMEDRMKTVKRLLDDLLDISRISEGKIALKREPVELGAVIRRAVLSTDHYRRERHQSLALALPDAPQAVTGDSVRLEQVVTNLLTNASKYSDSGDAIALTLRANDGIAEIEVADEGVGIDASALEKVFRPFHQIDHGERSKKGLGIGLALVKNFAEMHGGSVVASSEGAGKGSRFTVSLPRIAADARTASRDDAATGDAGSGANGKADGRSRTAAAARSDAGPLVLVVDDNDAAAGGIGRLLEMQGCRVIYAYDGKQAVSRAFSADPDVVLLDVGLPDQDGYNVAKTLRARGFAGRLIALSGYSTDEARERGAAAGFEHYLVKPVGLAELRHVLPELG